jgi:hypothetical protein
MHHRFIAMLALAALCLPAAHAFAQDEEVDASTLEAMSAALPEVNLGQQDNGWFLSRENGVCRMYSFNDVVSIQVDPANADNTRLEINMIDHTLAGDDGATVELPLGFRSSADGSYKVFPVPARVSREAGSYGYLIALPIQDLINKFPDGFQMVLLDADNNEVLSSSTLGTGKHLAALNECSGT